MADLDDFFAKKDRKKSKGKKFPTTDELAKKLDDPKQKPEVRPKKDRPVQEGEEAGRVGDEEEWKEYEEPVKDYTGLKIQHLQGGANAQESGKESASEDGNTSEGGKNKGPWNKPQQAPAVAEEPAAPAAAEEPAAPRAYVPPASRTRQPEPRTRAHSKHAPDIHNDDYFPVLGAGAAAARRGGGWSAAPAAGPPPRAAARAPLALGNRFTELTDDS